MFIFYDLRVIIKKFQESASDYPYKTRFGLLKIAPIELKVDRNVFSLYWPEILESLEIQKVGQNWILRDKKWINDWRWQIWNLTLSVYGQLIDGYKKFTIMPTQQYNFHQLYNLAMTQKAHMSWKDTLSLIFLLPF